MQTRQQRREEKARRRQELERGGFQDSGRLFTDQPIPVIHRKPDDDDNRQVMCDFEGHGDTCEHCHVECPNDPLPEE